MVAMGTCQDQEVDLTWELWTDGYICPHCQNDTQQMQQNRVLLKYLVISRAYVMLDKGCSPLGQKKGYLPYNLNHKSRSAAAIAGCHSQKVLPCVLYQLGLA